MPVLRYIARRLARALLLLAGVSIISFGLFEAAPGDYFAEVQLNPAVSRETVELLRQQHGLADPMPVRYVRWLESALDGELGYSLAYHRPAAPLVCERARNTLILTTTAALLSWVIAIPAGVWSAAGRSWRAQAAAIGISAVMALPDLLVVLVLTLWAASSGILPTGGMTSVEFDQMKGWAAIQDVCAHMVVPAGALVLLTLPALISHTRAAVAEVLQLPFITAARACGIRRRRLLFRHALAAAANPLITLLGLSIGTLLSSSLMVEAVVGWPGLGQLLLQSILQRDTHVVVGAVMFSAVLFVAGNLVADLLLCAVDPRIRGGR